ncbi:MAG: glycosyltransferase [Pelatocladus maniniholoensis HA4357-MV3]|jgi:glycosyltransferase involved in cell wall biosynthesis|uniref:Glycosyltransferase n=1 Tax=Pelatocladus maniniholoensis HA4357-MV3 TaxID=1117104 RepID=A0A9E3HB81_9NOST|nr:glycosyltransferase [Pelatocladus maniniholoensis HA4357-MV3]BAZ68898.1 group 1 glycosyl transferase [Fischerella sp. NIES-4106]
MKKQPLRIALITGLYAPFLTGVSIAVHQRVRWLLQQGHEVFLIHPEINDQYPEEVGNRPMEGLKELQTFPKFSSYAFPTQPLIFYKSLPQPLHNRHWSDTKLLENYKPDIVIVEEAPQMRGFYSLYLQGYGRPVGIEYAKKTGTPIISLFHTDIVAYIRYYMGNQFFSFIRPMLPMLIKQFSEAYDHNFFSSREQLEKYQSLKSQRSEYLPYQGIDCQKFNPANISYNPIPNDNRPTLLFVGRIAPEKSVIQLLDIYPIVAAKIPDVHLVIVGSGPQQEEIRQRAAQFGKGVTVWGESHGTELLGWYARADVFVNASVTENFCTSTNEALASGTPVIAVKAPSTSEQVVPGRNGFLAQPNSPWDFANKVIRILENPELKEEMSLHARFSVLEYDWSVCMQKFEQRLHQIVEKSNNLAATPIPALE